MTLFNHPVHVFTEKLHFGLPLWELEVPGITAEQYLLHGDYFVANSLASQTKTYQLNILFHEECKEELNENIEISVDL